VSNQNIKIKGSLEKLNRNLLHSQTTIDVNLDEMYGRTVAEMTLQQSKRDQIIASYLTVLSLATSVAMTSEHITPAMQGGFFLAAGIIGILLSMIIIRYRVYKEAYWLCCQAISVMFGYDKKKLNKELIQNVYRATMLKKGKGYCKPVPNREDEVQPAFKLEVKALDDDGLQRRFSLLDRNGNLLQQETGCECTFRILWADPKQEKVTYILRESIAKDDGKQTDTDRPVKITFSRDEQGTAHARALMDDLSVPLKRDPEVRFSRWKYVWKNKFSAETIYLFIQALICATVTTLGFSFVLPTALRWPVSIMIGVGVLVWLLWLYFAKCIEVYSWLIDGKESSFNKAFGKAWLLHFYH